MALLRAEYLSNIKWIYAAYEKCIELRAATGRLYDWDDLALYTYYELQDDNEERLYSHIIDDEGQDFSPMMIWSNYYELA